MRNNYLHVHISHTHVGPNLCHPLLTNQPLSAMETGKTKSLHNSHSYMQCRNLSLPFSLSLYSDTLRSQPEMQEAVHKILFKTRQFHQVLMKYEKGHFMGLEANHFGSMPK